MTYETLAARAHWRELSACERHGEIRTSYDRWRLGVLSRRFGGRYVPALLAALAVALLASACGGSSGPRPRPPDGWPVFVETEHGRWGARVDPRCQPGLDRAALAEHIDEALEGLEPAEVELSRQVFIDLRYYLDRDLSHGGETVYTNIESPSGQVVITVPCGEGHALVGGIPHDLKCHGLPAVISGARSNAWRTTCHPAGNNPLGFYWVPGAPQ